MRSIKNHFHLQKARFQFLRWFRICVTEVKSESEFFIWDIYFLTKREYLSLSICGLSLRSKCIRIVISYIHGTDIFCDYIIVELSIFQNGNKVIFGQF